MKSLKPLLPSLLLTLGLLSGCGPSTSPQEPEAAGAPRDTVAQPLCMAARCSDAFPCAPCEGAEGFCNSRGVCEYTSTGGGGGGGGGSGPTPYCEGARCSSDEQCVSYCYHTDAPRCVSGYCSP